MELKGFQKVTLKAGESRDVNISINNAALCFYDDTVKTWRSEAGEFTALVGTASDNIILNKKFTLQ